MKITRTRLEEMIAEEVSLGLAFLREAGDKKPSKPETTDAEKSPARGSADLSNSRRQKDALPVGTNPLDTDGMDDKDPGPVDPEQEDDAGEDEADAVDAGGDADEPTGAVNDEVSGKTVQAVTIEPKSKILPGAKEILVSFHETTDALRILVTATGQVKFFFRGQLHDLP